MLEDVSGREFWWTKLPDERFWIEITDRPDVGVDLKCPQADRRGKSQPSYDLIRQIWPGDIIFHYWIKQRAVVGASVAGGPLEERPIVWIPHGIAAKPIQVTLQGRGEVPGYWLPLYDFCLARNPLTLTFLQSVSEDAWVRTWIDTRHETTAGPVAAPFQRYKGKIRAAQAYLAKMPLAFVERWPELSELADRLAYTETQLTAVGDLYPAGLTLTSSPELLKLKNEEDYFAIVKGGIQRRSRTHERLLRLTAEYLLAHQAKVTTSHPLDLLMTYPVLLILEGKPIGIRGPLFAIREAVGQLFEYRRFIGPREAKLCVLLDGDPGEMLVEYLEEVLDIRIMWLSGSTLFGGPVTSKELSAAGVLPAGVRSSQSAEA